MITNDPNISGQEPTSERISKSIGEEFMEWAEQGWALQRLIDNEIPSGSESVSYKVIKPYFIQKINEIIAKRINTQVW